MNIIKLRRISNYLDDQDQPMFVSGERAMIAILKNSSKLQNFQFYIEMDGVKRLKMFGPDHIDNELVDRQAKVSDKTQIQFHDDGSIELLEGFQEALIPKRSLDQLKSLRKMTKGIDIADRIPDLQKQGANIHYSRNAVDSGIESYEDFQAHNRKFIPSWNLKHLTSPFQGEK